MKEIQNTVPETLVAQAEAEVLEAERAKARITIAGHLALRARVSHQLAEIDSKIARFKAGDWLALEDSSDRYNV